MKERGGGPSHSLVRSGSSYGDVMAETFQTITPVNGAVYAERAYATTTAIAKTLAAARHAKAVWKRTPLADRAALCTRFVEAFASKKAEIAEEISWQMGRPVTHAPGEVEGAAARARYMIRIAEDALGDIEPGSKAGSVRRIRREPLGVVLTLAPWNYPYLTAINSIVPAIMAGNVVVLKASSQTPLCAERFAEAFAEAGAPEGVFQYLHLTHADSMNLVQSTGIDHVVFTGSVEGGRAVQRAASERFIGVGLELGGKDPAYVRHDAPFEHTVSNLVEGVFYNAGQSCCAIERMYVHEALFDPFVEDFVERVRAYRLGDPLDPDTTLGPVVRTRAAAYVREQVDDAIGQGARALIAEREFPEARAGTPYLAPQVLTGVDHSMRIMWEETFGPAIGIMKVASDEEAVALMNDSPFGLTGSVWTTDEGAALAIGDQVETGTWFMNRCDYLDPALAWTGVKDSGRGCALSRIGYEHLTRPKSFHLRIE